MRSERYSRKTMEQVEEGFSELEDPIWKYEYDPNSDLVL
jgi:hypothetical protein